MSENIRICFIADRHDLFDDRIYWKMAVPLKNLGYEVHYILLGGKNKKGMSPEGVFYQMFKLKNFSKNRYLNFILKRLNPKNNYKKLYQEAVKLEADIYHFHDLWINRFAGKLKKLPHKSIVFYDAREPYAEDYMSYSKVSPLFKFVIKRFAQWVDRWEKRKAKQYDLVIANEETVCEKFALKIGKDKATTLFNYSDLHHDYQNIPYDEKEYDLIYCGGISLLRGPYEILKAILKAKLQIPNIKVVFLGKYYPYKLKAELQEFLVTNDLVNNVVLLDSVSYKEVSSYYNKSKIGLVLLHKVKTFEISMPIKVFEYMCFGLPIIGSNFGHIKSYVEKENCGVVVNPTDHEDISNAIVSLLQDRKLYDNYSQQSRKAALTRYKWEFEFEKLLNFYNKALNER